MSDSINSMGLFITDYGNVKISPNTLRAMDATFPGWRDAPIKGRARAVRRYNERARRGREVFEQVVNGISFLAWAADQDLLQI